jgi:hypothetical protein
VASATVLEGGIQLGTRTTPAAEEPAYPTCRSGRAGHHPQRHPQGTRRLRLTRGSAYLSSGVVVRARRAGPSLRTIDGL